MSTVQQALGRRDALVTFQTSESALAQDRHRGTGIPFVKIGGRVRYLRQDVLAYLAANRMLRIRCSARTVQRRAADLDGRLVAGQYVFRESALRAYAEAALKHG